MSNIIPDLLKRLSPSYAWWETSEQQTTNHVVDNSNLDTSISKVKPKTGPGSDSHYTDTMAPADPRDKEIEKYTKPHALTPEQIQQKKSEKVQEFMSKMEEILAAMKKADVENGTPGASEKAVLKVYQMIVDEQEELASMLKDLVIESNDEKRESTKEKIKKELEILEQTRSARTLSLVTNIAGILGTLSAAAIAGTAAPATLAIAGASILLVADQMNNDGVKHAVSSFLSWGDTEREKSIFTGIGWIASTALMFATASSKFPSLSMAVSANENMRRAQKWYQGSMAGFMAASEFVQGYRQKQIKGDEVKLMDATEKVEGSAGKVTSNTKRIEDAITSSHKGYTAASNVIEGDQETISTILNG